MRDSLHNRLGPLRRITTLEDTRAHKNTITPQLHHQRGIRRRRHAARRKIHNRQPPQPRRLLQQREIRPNLLGHEAQLGVRQLGRASDIRADLAHVAHGLDDVTRARLALGADHGGAFGDAAEGFAQVAAPAYEGDPVGVFVDVVEGVGRGEDFGFVNVVDAEGFEDLWGWGLAVVPVA